MFLHKVAYLADIFNNINELNLNLQANHNIIDLHSSISGFVKKLKVWSQRVSVDNIEMFPIFKAQVESKSNDFKRMKTIVVKHLAELLKHFNEYFPEIKERYKYEWIWNPFKVRVRVKTYQNNRKTKSFNYLVISYWNQNLKILQ